MNNKTQIVGYFLALERMCRNYNCDLWAHQACVENVNCKDSGIYFRWIEHNVIAFEIVDLLTVEIISPMGGKWRELSPYKFYRTRKEMMADKEALNREIVRQNEPHNWIYWGINECEGVFDNE